MFPLRSPRHLLSSLVQCVWSMGFCLCLVATSGALAATTQKTTRYEAELAMLSGPVVDSTKSGFSGTGYADYTNATGDFIEWTVSAETTGAAELIFRYALETGDRPLQIKVNGVVVAASLSFPATGAWTTWGNTAKLTVTLNQGNNTIRATAIGSSGGNLDYLQVKETAIPISGPLMTVYDGQNQTGSSAAVEATHVIYSGVTIPGGLNDQISSFVLAQGYMAVVADQIDGLQPSKVYIAADGPLVVNTLPTNLDDAISFIRVVPWENTRKKGFCGGDDVYRSKFDHSWYYDWTKAVQRGQRAYGPESVPMCWDERYVQINDFLAQDQVTHLLSFNEPDGAGQANMLVADAVPLHVELQKAGLRLGSPACEEQNAYVSGRWLPDFMTQVDALGARVDYINVHWYDWDGLLNNKSAAPVDIANRLKTYLSNVYKRYRKPIWITEFNANGPRSREIQDAFLQEIMPYLDDCGYIERYAYYQWSDSMRFVDATTGELTSTGILYNNHQSPTAYTAGGLPAPWLDADIGTTNAGASIYNGNFTVSGSGAGLSGASDGCRFVYQPMSGDCTVTALVSSQIWPNSFAMSGVMIRETLDANSKQVAMTLSWSDGSKFRRRTTTGGTVVASTDSAIPKYPYWVRLVREGNSFSAYQSPDGIVWTQLGTTQTITMNTDVYVGMAVTSYSDGNFNDAIFKHVSVTQTLGQSLYIDWTRNDFSGVFTDNPVGSDPDGDKLTNLQEFAFGLDPTVPLSPSLSFSGGSMEPGLPIVTELPGAGGVNAFHGVFSRRKYHLLAGLTYDPQFSADLIEWTSSAEGLAVEGENTAGTMEAISVPFPSTVPVAADGEPDAPPRFFRVAVSQ